MFEESKTEILITFFKKFNFIILKHWTILKISKTEIIIIILKFLLNFIILKLSTVLKVLKRETVINFLIFFLNFIILKHSNYPLRIQNRNNNYF